MIRKDILIIHIHLLSLSTPPHLCYVCLCVCVSVFAVKCMELTFSFHYMGPRDQIKVFHSWMWWHGPLITAFRRQRQGDLCELEDSLVYGVSARTVRPYREMLCQNTKPTKKTKQNSGFWAWSR